MSVMQALAWTTVVGRQSLLPTVLRISLARYLVIIQEYYIKYYPVTFIEKNSLDNAFQLFVRLKSGTVPSN